MNIIRGYVEGVEIEAIAAFETTEELLDIGFVKKYKNISTFSKFSIDKKFGNLICETTDNKWYVVGELECSLYNINLPEWKPPRYY